MTNIQVYDDTAERLEKLSDRCEATVAEIVDALLDEAEEDIVPWFVNEEKKESLKEDIDFTSFKKELKDTIPEKDIDTYRSDLYVRITPETTALIKKYGIDKSTMLSKFRDNIEHDMWYELPFVNMGEFIEDEKKELDEAEKATENGEDVANNESLTERNLTKVERRNRNMNRIFSAKKSQDNKAKEFLKKKGYEEKTIKELEDKDELSKEIVDVFGVDKWEEILRNNNESLTESMSDDERRTALAKHLNAPVDTISQGYREEVFETEDGEEYWVVDKDEARRLAIEDVENFIEEVGVTGFTKSFQEWIFDNAVKKDWFEYALDESNDSYIYDITLEEANDDRYPSRLVEEAVEAGIISEEEGENFDMNSDDKYDLQDKYKTYLNDQVDDPIQWYRDNFGDRKFNEMVTDYGLTDDYAIAEEVVDVDGIAHSLATYDGNEIILDNGLFAYRIN